MRGLFAGYTAHGPQPSAQATDLLINQVFRPIAEQLRILGEQYPNISVERHG
jgi:hypothetical protein